MPVGPKPPGKPPSAPSDARGRAPFRGTQSPRAREPQRLPVAVCLEPQQSVLGSRSKSQGKLRLPLRFNCKRGGVQVGDALLRVQFFGGWCLCRDTAVHGTSHSELYRPQGCKQTADATAEARNTGCCPLWGVPGPSSRELRTVSKAGIRRLGAVARRDVLIAAPRRAWEATTLRPAVARLNCSTFVSRTKCNPYYFLRPVVSNPYYPV